MRENASHYARAPGPPIFRLISAIHIRMFLPLRHGI